MSFTLHSITQDCKDQIDRQTTADPQVVFNLLRRAELKAPTLNGFPGFRTCFLSPTRRAVFHGESGTVVFCGPPNAFSKFVKRFSGQLPADALPLDSLLASAKPSPSAAPSVATNKPAEPVQTPAARDQLAAECIEVLGKCIRQPLTADMDAMMDLVQAQQKSLDAASQQTSRRLDDAGRSLSGMQEQLACVEANRTEVAHELAILQRDAAQHAGRFDQLESCLAEHARMLSDRGRKLADVGAQLADVEADLEERRREAIAADGRVAAAVDRLVGVEDRQHAFETRVTHFQATVAGRSELEALERAVAQRHDALEVETSRVAATVAELATAANDVRSRYAVKSELQTLQAAIAKQLEAESAALKDSLLAVQASRSRRFEDAVAELQQGVAELRAVVAEHLQEHAAAAEAPSWSRRVVGVLSSLVHNGDRRAATDQRPQRKDAVKKGVVA